LQAVWFGLAITTLGGGVGLGQASGQVFTPGLLKMEVYDLSDTDLLDLTLMPLFQHPTFPDRPSEVYYIRSFDSKYAFPDRMRDNYGTRISGLFIPPVTGNYIFYLRSDDASQLWFNPGGSSEAGKVLIAEESECCGLFGEHASLPIPLLAGERYYIEAIHREGPEYDYLQVAFKRDTDPTDPDFLFPISHKNVGIFASPDGVVLTSDPAHNAVAVLPPDTTDPLLLAETFQSNDGGFTVSNDFAQGPWTYAPESDGVWYAPGHRDCAGTEASRLNSPVVTVQRADPVYIVFKHRYSFQYYEEAFDGGQLRISVNRGPYTPVPASRFLHNGYNGVVRGNNLLTGQEAFTNTSRGHQSGYHITSVAQLGRFNPGDTISVQFMVAWDECTSGDYPDWEIADVWITHTVAEISVGAAGYLPVEGQVPVAYTWQRDTGSGYVDVGSIEETLWLAPTMADDWTRYRARLAVPGLALFSEPVTLRLTREPTCSLGGPYVATCAGDRPGLTVSLNASGSEDPDGGRLSFAWSTACPGVTIDDPTSPSPTLFFGAGFGSRATCDVTLTITNDVGVSVTCTASVDTSLSTIRPVITLNGTNQTFDCDGTAANQYVELGATAVDGCGLPVDVIVGPPANTRRKGTQTVTYDAMDIFGNNAQQVTRLVVVEEGPAELVDIPGNLVTECSVPGGILATDPDVAAWLNTPKAVDSCDADESVVNDAPELLPLGATLVTWTLWDDGPTDQTGSATIEVQDTQPPTVNCVPLELQADESGNVVVPDLRSLLQVADACTLPDQLIVVQTPAAGTVLGLGSYEVTFSVTDRAASAHTTTCNTTLNVTAVGAEQPEPPGCGAAACGGNAMLSLSVIGLGLAAIKRRYRITRR